MKETPNTAKEHKEIPAGTFNMRIGGTTYAVVLAYLPPERKDDLARFEDYSDTMYPEGIETVPKRFAIDWRNHWLLKQADYVVAYITHSWGGAAQYAELAAKKRKIVINLTE